MSRPQLLNNLPLASLPPNHVQILAIHVMEHLDSRLNRFHSRRRTRLPEDFEYRNSAMTRSDRIYMVVYDRLRMS